MLLAGKRLPIDVSLVNNSEDICHRINTNRQVTPKKITIDGTDWPAKLYGFARPADGGSLMATVSYPGKYRVPMDYANPALEELKEIPLEKAMKFPHIDNFNEETKKRLQTHGKRQYRCP
ncbi:uncharacterized protein LOC141856823 [Brevipalpus obovatus]|uniref:uncharacterized protein LOC141856823 n=1 Tax=Brevipalpus obovatus TaxID=246614 RepID=UPI003D9F96DC